jgi:hypothetical protein
MYIMKEFAGVPGTQNNIARCDLVVSKDRVQFLAKALGLLSSPPIMPSIQSTPVSNYCSYIFMTAIRFVT